MKKLKLDNLIAKFEMSAVIVGFIVTVIWTINDPGNSDRYIILLSTVPVLADAIRRMRKETILTEEQHFVLAFIMTDPMATTRGAWLYPLHQNLTYRGYTENDATSILSTLEQKGMIKHLDVPTYDDFSKQTTTAPAYKITEKGIKYVNKHRDLIPKIKDTYYYRVRVYGSKNDNEKFLERIKKLDFVQAQTRFIVEADERLSCIAIFAYKEVDRNDIEHIASINDTRIYSFEETN